MAIRYGTTFSPSLAVCLPSDVVSGRDGLYGELGKGAFGISAELRFAVSNDLNASSATRPPHHLDVHRNASLKKLHAQHRGQALDSFDHFFLEIKTIEGSASE